MINFTQLLFKYFIPLVVAYLLALQVDDYITFFADSISEAFSFVIWLFTAGFIYAGAYYATRWIFAKIGLIDDWG